MNVSEAFHTSWETQKGDAAAALLNYREKLLTAIEAGQNEIAGFYKALIVRLLCIKPRVYKQLTPAQIVDVADDLKFINDPWYAFHITYLKTKHGTIHRPAVRLLSLTFWQFIMADAEYSKFLILNFRESDEQFTALDNLIATLYQTEPGQFDDTVTDKYAAALPYALTFDLKYLILHTYSNCRKYIMHERCKSLFASAPQAESKERREPAYTGAQWQKLLFDLAETPAFSGLENAKNARLYDALDYLEKKANEQTQRR